MKLKALLLAAVFGLATLGVQAQNSGQDFPQTPVQNGTQAPVQNPQPDVNQPVYNQQNQPVYGQNMTGQTIPAGTTLSIRTDNEIKAQDAQAGSVYPATISDDVVGQNGAVIIPRNSPAQLTVVNTGKTITGKPELSLALQSVTVNGINYMVQSDTVSGGQNNGGIGANKRTGVYVGGGALVGTLIGAMAGGAKGAAIGALIGAAGGAGTQVLTRGNQINVPAESVLKFKLDQPMFLQR